MIRRDFHAGHPLLGVAIDAVDRGMLARQRETGGGVVEVHHAVAPIVAIHTGAAKILNMLDHKIRLALAMAIQTGCRNEGISLAGRNMT